MVSQREYDRFQEAMEDVEVRVEDVCIEIAVAGEYVFIEDLPGETWYDLDGDEGVDVNWEFLSEFPQIEAEIVHHYNVVSEIDAADRYTRRAESGWSDV